MQIYTYPDDSKILQEATKKLNSLLEENKNTSVLLLLSGGSALQIIEGIQAKYLTRDLTVTVLDERYSTDEKVNSFAQIAHSDFYEMLMRHGAHVIDTRLHHNESQEDLANRFENGLRQWRDTNPKGKIIATLGMGKDGHISGIMPYEHKIHEFEKLFQSKKWVVGYDAKDKNPHPLRVTTTMTFLKKIDHAVMYIVGKSKKAALDNTLREKYELYKYPARIIHEIKDVHIYTDLT